MGLQDIPGSERLIEDLTGLLWGEHGGVRIAGHQRHRPVDPPGPNGLPQLDPVHPRHHHIAQNHIGSTSGEIPSPVSQTSSTA